MSSILINKDSEKGEVYEAQVDSEGFAVYSNSRFLF